MTSYDTPTATTPDLPLAHTGGQPTIDEVRDADARAMRYDRKEVATSILLEVGRHCDVLMRHDDDRVRNIGRAIEGMLFPVRNLMRQEG